MAGKRTGRKSPGEDLVDIHTGQNAVRIELSKDGGKAQDQTPP
jgi:hypothetical protein